MLALMGQTPMARVLVRDLDAAVVERLKARAQLHGRSLQKELKAILEEAAAKSSWTEASSAAERVRQMLGDRQFSDSTELVREDRDR
jgi:plasmid stability protein